jgi:coenzyme PQQ precursor peptide PqqA
MPVLQNEAVARGHRWQIDCKEMSMKWETPQATDFRFGMEITMYIANR